MSNYLKLVSQWRRKCNPAYPTPAMVKEEIIQMCKGMATATLCPSLSLFLTNHGYSKAYCGVGDHGWTYLIVSFFVTSIVADFCEFYYHRMGHVYRGFWRHHKVRHANKYLAVWNSSYMKASQFATFDYNALHAFLSLNNMPAGTLRLEPSQIFQSQVGNKASIVRGEVRHWM